VDHTTHVLIDRGTTSAARSRRRRCAFVCESVDDILIAHVLLHVSQSTIATELSWVWDAGQRRTPGFDAVLHTTELPVNPAHSLSGRRPTNAKWTHGRAAYRPKVVDRPPQLGECRCDPLALVPFASTARLFVCARERETALHERFNQSHCRSPLTAG